LDDYITLYRFEKGAPSDYASFSKASTSRDDDREGRESSPMEIVAVDSEDASESEDQEAEVINT
jgi:hypothetical protein